MHGCLGLAATARTVEHEPVQRLDGDLADIVGDGDPEPLPGLEEIIDGTMLALVTRVRTPENHQNNRMGFMTTNFTFYLIFIF